MQKTTGILYLVPTPLGNLDDMTRRSADTLQKVDYIAAEDTRRAALLLSELGIGKKLISYYEQNAAQRSDKILADLLLGSNVAVITDAGMPCISDPGALLVRQCVEKQIKVKALPGACALVTVLAASGLDPSRFVFEGFLPTRGRERKTVIAEIAAEKRTVVFYEAPHRLCETLHDLAAAGLAARRITLGREISKAYEEYLRFEVQEGMAYFAKTAPRGEFTAVLEGKTAFEKRAGVKPEYDQEMLQKLLRAEMQKGSGAKRAAEAVELSTGVNKRELYNLALEVKDLI